MRTTKSSGRRAAARPPSAAVRAIHELFVAGQVDASYLDSTPLRRVVAESWQRSLAKGVDPDRGGAQSCDRCRQASVAEKGWLVYVFAGHYTDLLGKPYSNQFS